jgi:hypothetical protein
VLGVVACSSAPAPEPPRDPIVTPREPEPAAVEPRRDLTVEMAPMSLVSTGTAIVWTDMTGAIWTLPDGGQPKQLSDQKHPDFAFSLFLAGTEVLATSRHGVLRVGLPDGPVTALAIDGLPDQPEEAVADASFMYLTIFKRDAVVRVPVGGGTAQRLAELPRGVLGLHGSTLYIASYSTGILYALPTTGGKPRVIVKGLPRPTAVAADEMYAYVYCERDRTLRRIELATGAMITLADQLVNSDEVVLDGDWLYTRSWGTTGSLIRIPRAGGAMQTLADDLKSPYRVATDAEAIYVTSRDDRRIVRLAKSALPR